MVDSIEGRPSDEGKRRRLPLWGDPRKRSRRLDVLAGIALPLTLLAIDPVVFHQFGDWEAPAYYSEYRGACYVMTACCVSALAVWIYSRRWPGLCSGVMWVGALFALGLAVVLLPVSLIGAFAMGIGLLGLTPFWMAFVYWRKAMEAANQVTGWRDTLQGLAGIAFVLVAGAGTQIVSSKMVKRGVAQTLSVDAGRREAGIRLLRRALPLHDVEVLVALFRDEQDPERQQRIADVYREVTGDEMFVMMD